MAPPNTPTPGESAATQAQADAMSNLARALEAASKNQQSYNQAAASTADAMSEISEAAQKQVDGITSASESMKSLSDSFKNSSKLTKVTIKDLAQLAKEYAKNSKAIQTAVVAFKTFAATLKAFKAIGGGIVSTIGSIAGAIFELGAAIISAPFKMIEWLIGRAKKGMGGTELAQEYENVREVFGDIAKGTSKDVINIGRSLATGVIAPGLMARQVFGTLAEAIKEIREVAEAAPAAFQMLSSQFNRSGLQIMAMAKGLGIGKEELVGLESRAIATGEEIITTFAEMTKYSKNLGAQFGLNSKAMSRDMGRAMKDVKHFANATVKEIAEATVYAHKLGFELKDITGVLDAFNTFDQAAENVAKLSQAFGVNIDVMKLMEANTPADALDEIKKAFNAVNKSADQMNRHELQLLAQTVGLTEEQVKQGLSMKNAGVAMDAVKSSSAALQTQTLDTGKAISMLANDIKKLVKEGETPEGGTFFEIFIEGFVLGIDRSKEFQSLLQAVRKDMYVVRDAGKAVGAAFVQFFPGFKEFLDGVKTFLDPSRIKSLMAQVIKTFTDFFKSLSSGTATFEGLLDSLQKNFFNFFSSDKGGQKILSGLSKMWKAVERIISTGIDWLTKKIKTGIQFLIDLLNGDELSSAGDKLEKNVLGGLSAAKKSPIIKSLINAYEQLEKPLGTLFEKLFSLAIDKLGYILSEYKWEIALVTFGPTVASLFAQAIAGPIVKAAFAKMVEGFAPNLANILRGGIPAGAPGAPGAPGAAGAARGAAGGMGALGQVTLVATAAYIGFETGKAIANAVADSVERYQDSFREGTRKTNEALSNLNVSAQDAARSIAKVGGLSKEEAQRILEQKKAAEAAISEQKRKLEELRQKEAEVSSVRNVQTAASFTGISSIGLGAQAVGSLGEMLWDDKKELKDTVLGQYIIGTGISAEDRKKLEEELAADEARYKEFLDKHGNNLAIIADTASGKIPEKIAEAAQDNSADMLEKLGLDAEFTIETAAEQLKKVDELAKKVLSKDFNLPETIAQIKEKLSTVKWDIISLESEKELKKSAEVMGSLQKVFESIKNSLSSVYESAQVSSKLGTAGGGGLIDNYKTGVLSLLLVAIEIKQSLQKLDFSVIKEKVEPLKSAFEAIKEAITPAKEVVDLLKKNFSNDKSEELGTHTENFKKSIDKINKGIGGIATTSGYTSVATTSAAQNVKATGDAIKTSFTPLLESIGMLAYLPKALSQTVIALSDPKFFSNIAALGKFLGTEGEELSIASKFSSIGDLSGTELNISSWLTDAETITASIETWTNSPTFKNIESVTNEIVKSEASFSKILGAMSAIESHANDLAGLDITEAVSKMVENMNSMNASLSNIEIGKNGEIRVKLGEIAAGITKADETFNIKKAPITINMEVHVELAVSNIEKAIMKANGAVKAAFNNLANLSNKGVSESGALFPVDGRG